MRSPVGTGFEFAEALFEFEAEQFESAGTARGLFYQLVEQLSHKAVASQPAPIQAAIFSHILFQEFGFGYGAGLASVNYTLTGTLLRRRGACVGLASLYSALADAVGLPLQPVLFEGHLAVRHLGFAVPKHIEVSCRGALWGERMVVVKYGSAGRLLSLQEFQAVHLNHRAAFVLAPKRNYTRALEMLERAIELVPEYQSPWINRAAICIDLEDWTGALETLATCNRLGSSRSYTAKVCALRNLIMHKIGRSSSITTSIPFPDADDEIE